MEGPDVFLDREEIVEKIRKWMDWSDTLVTAGLFFVIVKFKLGFDSHFSTAWDMLSFGNWSGFAQSNGVLLPMTLVIFADFTLIRGCAKQELGHVPEAFSNLTSPQNFSNVIGAYWIPFVIPMFYLLFFGLIAVVDRPAVLGLALLGWNAIDYFVARLSIDNMLRYFDDKRFAPPDRDPFKRWILERREVAKAYFQHRFYLPRIGVLAAFNALGLALATGWVAEVPGWAPYVVFMGVFIGNEIFMGFLRGRRERDFAAIRLDERRAILKSTGEGSDALGAVS